MKEVMKLKEKRVAGFNGDTGKCWGLVCLVPFGWVFFWASIIRRKNDVIKYKTLDAGLALGILHNYIVGFIIVTVVVVILCFGYFAIPNLIALVAITITYNVAVDKILQFEEGKPDKHDNVWTKLKAKRVKQRHKDDARDDEIKRQLEVLKEQNRRQADVIGKLEKEINKRGK